MEVLNFEKSKEWLIQRQIILNDRNFLTFQSGISFRIDFPLPTLALKIFAFTYNIAVALEDDRKSVKEYLVWLREKDMWSEDTDALGNEFLKRLAGMEDEGYSLKSGQLIQGKNKVELRSALAIPMLFQWDSYLIPEHGEYFGFTSHDQLFSMFTNSESTMDLILQRMSSWNPKISTTR